MTRERLRAIFGVSEVEQDPRLRLILGGHLFFFHMTFGSWYGRPGLSTTGIRTFNFVPMWFLEQAPIVFLDQFWTKLLMYALCMLALGGIGLLLTRKSCLEPVLILATLLAAKILFYVSDLRLMGNYHHIHILMSGIFLLSRSKLFFTRIGLLVCYELSFLSKLTPSWWNGEYFNSVASKFPLLPHADWAVVWESRAVIFLESLGPLLWFAPQSSLRLSSMAVFLFFHIYSGAVVGPRYPTLMLPIVWGAFTGFDRPVQAGYRFVRRDVAAWLFLIVAMLGGFVQLLIPGDVRLTAEGRFFGLYMYDANRAIRFETEIAKGPLRVACSVRRSRRDGAIIDEGDGSRLERDQRVGIAVDVYRGGVLTESRRESTVVRDGGVVVLNTQLFEQAAYRTNGDPYLYYFYGKELCRRYAPDRLSMRLVEQLDGRPEEHVVMDIADFCTLNPTYSAFRHNPWILLD